MARTSASARSAQVLDEAQRMEDILNWQLFTMEQETKLWGYNPDVEWVPGEPIHKHPKWRQQDRYDRVEDLDEYDSEGNPDLWQGPDGNHIRPMIQEFEDGDWVPETFYERHGCNDCQVLGDPADDWCWSCGMSYRPRPQPKRYVHTTEIMPGIQVQHYQTPNEVREELGFTVDYDVDHNQIVYRAEMYGGSLVHALRAERERIREMIQRPEVINDRDQLEHWVMRGVQLEVGPDWIREMTESMRAMHEAARRMAVQVRESQTRFMQGMRHMWFYLDEAAEIEPYRFQPPASVPYHPPTSGYISNPNRGWWEKPNVVGPLWGIAALYDPREESPLVTIREWNELKKAIPSNWRELRVENPYMALEMTERPAISVNEPAWVQFNNQRMDRASVRNHDDRRRRSARRRRVEGSGSDVHRSRSRRS